jgi:hypothetical protein
MVDLSTDIKLVYNESNYILTANSVTISFSHELEYMKKFMLTIADCIEDNDELKSMHWCAYDLNKCSIDKRIKASGLNVVERNYEGGCSPDNCTVGCPDEYTIYYHSYDESIASKIKN